MLYLRTAKTRGGSDVRIILDEPDYIVGVYWSENPRLPGWIPQRWSKLSPFINGSFASGLDLMEDITRIKI